MSSPFSYEAPALPTPTSPLLPLLNTILDPLPTPPHLVALSDRLLVARVGKVVKKEMFELSGSLRDEWRARVGAVKADWMARIIPADLEANDDEDEDEQPASADTATDSAPTTTEAVASALEHTEVVSDPTALVVPTIISDADSQEAMSSRVDAAVEAEFNSRIAEAEERIKAAAERKELMEMELFLGEISLDSHSARFSPEQLPQALQQAIEDALEDLGVDPSEPAVVGGGIAVEGDLKNLARGVDGLELEHR